jgi:hypothetical protein
VPVLSCCQQRRTWTADLTLWLGIQ